jgi:tRNA-splicing ligase RtcB
LKIKNKKMSKLKITGKELRALGFPEGPVISIAMNIVTKQFKHRIKEEVMELLQKVLAAPVEYRNDAIVALIAEQLIPKEKTTKEISLTAEAVPLNVFGREHIDDTAMHQINMASRLPIAVAAALMPDAHAGYGLPIGGVLATENAVIPYGVGVDIGCRMCLSIYDIDPVELERRQSFFNRELGEATLFGSGGMFTKPSDHEVLERNEFNEIPLLKSLHGRAWKQLGTSGSGNHFVEFGVVAIHDDYMLPGVKAGLYTGLLSHSGSRGLGATIANHYTTIAKEKIKLPQEAANLAWLSLAEEAGIEYWIAMNLAGDYSSACHHIIHAKIEKQLGRNAIAWVENHHNFAWKEIHDGRELIVHRKGATPAAKNMLGIIPGSMTANGYIIKGKGEARSLNSAAHGAGRKMSRTVAMGSITHHALKEELEKYGVKLSGGGLDEAPFAYKDIETVMQSQHALVDIVGSFTPKIVRMCGNPPKSWKRKRGSSFEGE